MPTIPTGEINSNDSYVGNLINRTNRSATK